MFIRGITFCWPKVKEWAVPGHCNEWPVLSGCLSASQGLRRCQPQPFSKWPSSVAPTILIRYLVPVPFPQVYPSDTNWSDTLNCNQETDGCWQLQVHSCQIPLYLEIVLPDPAGWLLYVSHMPSREEEGGWAARTLCPDPTLGRPPPLCRFEWQSQILPDGRIWLPLHVKSQSFWANPKEALAFYNKSHLP